MELQLDEFQQGNPMTPNARRLADRLALALVDNETVRCPGEKCNGTLHAGTNSHQVGCPSCGYTITLYVRTNEETIIERSRSGKANPRRATRQTDEGRGLPSSKTASRSDQAREEEVVRGFLFQKPRSSGGGSGRNVDSGRRKTQSGTGVSE